MMTKKREMAEWILDFFRRSKIDTGQIVMMRTVQNKLIELNPRERDLFVPVANELIENGYFTYEEGQLQCLRLTQKGREYIYDPAAKLDCCYDERFSPSQTQYISNWHDNFVTAVKQWRGIVDILVNRPEATVEDKKGLEMCRLILDGIDVQDVEKNLANGIITKEILDKIAKLNRDLVDVAVEHLRTDAVVKEFWKKLAHLKIEQDKKAEEVRLKLMKIPVA